MAPNHRGDLLVQVRAVCLGLRLDVEPDWSEVAGIVEDGYRTVASKRLVAEFDRAGPASR